MAISREDQNLNVQQPAPTERTWQPRGLRFAAQWIRFLPAALALCVLTVATPSVATAQTSMAAPLATVISQDGLNLRTNPTTSAPIVATIPFASVVTITGAPTSDNWYPVSFGSLVGWSSGDYLTLGAVAPVTAANAPPLTVAIAATLNLDAVNAPTPSASAAVVTPPAVLAATPSAVVATGPSYVATATYYGVDDTNKAGQIMACGAPFDPWNAQATATNDWPCGTRLRVTGPDGTSIIVSVTDHGEYPSHWLDLTYAAFGKLADHKVGRIQVEVTPLQ